MDFTPEIERLPDTIAMALFRVLQESLTNADYHSGTSQVDVCFRREPEAAILEIRDYGRGMPRKLLDCIGPTSRGSGVGLAGMRERLNELKGGLEIEAADPGTKLQAILLLPGWAASAHA